MIIKCIYLPPTYLYFIQDIEDRCLLLLSSTSFVDPPFQEHRMTEKHRMDQNYAYLHYVQNKVQSQTKWHEKMTWHKARAQPSQGVASQPHHLGRPAMCWRNSKNHFVYMSSRGGTQGIQCPKAVQGGNIATRASCMAGCPDKWAPHAQSSAIAPPYSSYKYHGAPPGRKCEESEV
jgi:hypothetical protein